MPAPTIQYESLRAGYSWLCEGRGVVLATVVRIWGSAPCGVGSHLAVRDDGHFVGSVSGGCVEGEVIAEALDLMERGGVRLLEYGVEDAKAWEVGLACGGKLSVYLEKMPSDTGDLLQDFEARKPVVRGVCLEDGAARLFPPDKTQNSRIEEMDGKQWFLRAYLPPIRLMIVGAVHIAQSLSLMATESGYDVVIIDPREGFASPERFAEADVRIEWPEDALDALKLDSRCGLVALTHDPKIDDPALIKALSCDCFYVAALGSVRTHAARLERLRGMGVGEEKLERINGPAGLPIGSATPAEIAVSILAQMVEHSHR